MIFDLSFWDNYKNCVEATSGGNNTVMFDDLGQPSVMVRVPKFSVEDITAGAGTGVHPAFIIDSVEQYEFWAGMYPAYVANSRALSIPGVDPTVSINFDTSLLRCGSKGTGWHLMTNAEWAAIFLLSHAYAGADAVHGNTYYGRDYSATDEIGRRQDGVIPGTASGTARTLTGSGPLTWRHDLSPYGIADLVGNVWEWVGGYRLVDGEIQIIEDNDAALDQDGSVHDASTGDWQAVLEDGSLVAPGTADTLKWDATGATGEGDPVLSTTVSSQSDGSTSANVAYKDITTLGPVAPDILKKLGIYPHETNMNRGKFYMRNLDERLPCRGGGWSYSSGAGLAAAYLNLPRSLTFTHIGFRPAFVSRVL
jgi:formylglycine-generating enzyme